MSKTAWMKFYPADWRAEPRLRMCSLSARGLWIDLISYMHEGEPYGHFTIEGVAPDLDGMAALVSRPLDEVKNALAELEAKQVFSRAESGAIYSRRMVRDRAKAEADRENGKAGGNPALAKGVNPPVNGVDKAQNPEPRTQNPESKKNKNEFLGKEGRAPPRHGITSKRLKRIYVNKGTPEWEQYASDFREVHHVDPEPNQHGGRWFNITGEQALPDKRVSRETGAN